MLSRSTATSEVVLIVTAPSVKMRRSPFWGMTFSNQLIELLQLPSKPPHGRARDVELQIVAVTAVVQKLETVVVEHELSADGIVRERAVDGIGAVVVDEDVGVAGLPVHRGTD